VEDFTAEIQAKYGDKASEFFDIFKVETEADVKMVRNKLGLLAFAGMPAHLLGEYNSKPSYLYGFTHEPVDKPGFPNYGVFHTSEVPFALGNLHTWQRPWRPMDLEVQNLMHTYWVNFAKTGNPNGKDLPNWPKYSSQTGEILQINHKTSAQMGLFKKEFDFLSSEGN
jgi:para-nitrobenzyl esterase